MIKRTLGCLVMCGWLMASESVLAHHSLAATYDIRKEGQVTGVLTRVAFTNPHGAMHLESSRGGSVQQPLCGVSQNQPSPRWAQSALVVQSGRLQ